MLYRQKKDTYIRNYDGIGYITSTGIFNDRLVNKSGTVFLTVLSRTPQTLEVLADKILTTFSRNCTTVSLNSSVQWECFPLP